MKNWNWKSIGRKTLGTALLILIVSIFVEATALLAGVNFLHMLCFIAWLMFGAGVFGLFIVGIALGVTWAIKLIWSE